MVVFSFQTAVVVTASFLKKYYSRTFARKASTTQILFIVWLQSDNELPMSEMQKNLGGHRLRFRNKARGKLLQF